MGIFTEGNEGNEGVGSREHGAGGRGIGTEKGLVANVLSAILNDVHDG